MGAHDPTSRSEGLDQTEPSVTVVDGVAPAAGSGATATRVGRFVVTSVLGRGGMGTVLAAHDPDLDRTLAVKLMNAPGGSEGSLGARERMLREARAMARLSHANVLTVFEVGTFQEQVYIAMEFAPGGTLRQWCRQAPRSPRDIVDKFLMAGRGLQAAHEAGFVHRDFKPENVLLMADGRGRVADFGLVGCEAIEVGSVAPTGDRSADAAAEMPIDSTLTQSGSLLGTPLYMSPEQHRRERAGPAADQFAFCVALYEALFDQHPFGGNNYWDLMHRVLSGQVREPRDASHVPDGTRRAIMRGLSTNPADRWPAMDALLAALSSSLGAHDRFAIEPGQRERVVAAHRLLDEARGLKDRGQYTTAASVAAAAAREAGSLAFPPLEAESLYLLGSLQETAGDLAAAEEALRRALVSAGRARDDNLSTRIWGELLWVIGYQQHRLSDVLLLRPAADASLERTTDPLVRAAYFSNLGAVLFGHEEYAEALAMFTRTLQIEQQEFGAESGRLATTLSNVGYALLRLARHDEARTFLLRAQAAWESLFGADHPNTAIALNNLGELALAEGNLEDARSLLVRSLAIRDRTLSPHHPFTALSLANLGEVLAALGAPSDARKHLERAAAIYGRLYSDPNHPQTVRVARALSGLG